MTDITEEEEDITADVDVTIMVLKVKKLKTSKMKVLKITILKVLLMKTLNP